MNPNSLWMSPSLLLVSCLMFSGCMEGTQGPPGPTGRDGFGAADSLVFDPMEPFLLWCKQDTGYVFSPAAQARYDRIDKSKYLFDSVTWANGERVYDLFIKTKFDAQYWWTTQKNTGIHLRSDSGSTDWFIKRRDEYWAAKAVPISVQAYPAVGNYFPGKGFDLYYAKFFPPEGEAKILYWK